VTTEKRLKRMEAGAATPPSEAADDEHAADTQVNADSPGEGIGRKE
jgi:hypothetical protein